MYCSAHRHGRHITGHSSQGMTKIRLAIISFGRELYNASGYVYMCLTRTRAMEGLTLLQPLSSNMDKYKRRTDLIKEAQRIINNIEIPTLVRLGLLDAPPPKDPTNHPPPPLVPNKVHHFSLQMRYLNGVIAEIKTREGRLRTTRSMEVLQGDHIVLKHNQMKKYVVVEVLSVVSEDSFKQLMTNHGSHSDYIPGSSSIAEAQNTYNTIPGYGPLVEKKKGVIGFHIQVLQRQPATWSDLPRHSSVISRPPEVHFLQQFHFPSIANIIAVSILRFPGAHQRHLPKQPHLLRLTFTLIFVDIILSCFLIFRSQKGFAISRHHLQLPTTTSPRQPKNKRHVRSLPALTMSSCT
jgi:ASC-1-like (ASCH) protein